MIIKTKKAKILRLTVQTLIMIVFSTGFLFVQNPTDVMACQGSVCCGQTGSGGCRYSDSCTSNEFYCHVLECGAPMCCDLGPCVTCTPSSCDAGYTTTNTGCSYTTKSCTSYNCHTSCGTESRRCYLLKYTLTYTAGSNGSIVGTTPQSVCRGSNGSSVTADPDDGYHFVNWSDSSTANPRTDTNVTANKSVTANFAISNVAPTAPTSLLAEGATNPTGVTDTTPEFSAIFNDPNSTDTGEYYEIEVNTASDFSGTVMWDSGQVGMTSTANGARSPDISYAGTALSQNGAKYYWRIKFWDSFSAEGPWSATANFTMNTIPTAPTSLLAEEATNPTGVTDTTPEFSAIFNDPNTGDTGDYYQIQVNTASDFTGTIMWDSDITGMTPTAIGARSPDISYSGTTLSQNGAKYYWRIRFADNHGAVSTWSTTSNFTMNTLPTVPTSLLTEGSTNPTKVTDITPEFSAIFNDSDSGDTGEYYEIEVNTASDFSGTVMWDSGQVGMTSTANGARSPDISYAGTTLSLNGITYYWRIKFWDDKGGESNWSSTANYLMSGPPSASSLLTEDSTNPTFLSSASPYFSAICTDPNADDCSAYEINVNTTNIFNGTVLWDTDKISTTITSGNRSPDITYHGTPLTNSHSIYYWRIRFWDSDDNIGDWSSTAQFTDFYPSFNFEGLKLEGLQIN